MPRVVPDSLQAGMILSKPVVNANGVTLVMEGTELTDSMVEKIREMDVDYVYVKGAPLSGVSLEQMISDLDGRFEAVNGAPFMGLIKKALREHLESIYG
jgi:hypothetical protein